LVPAGLTQYGTCVHSLALMPATDLSTAAINASQPPMPTVLRSGPYRVYFYSHESKEPPHVHVDRDQISCKFWLSPVGLANNLGFRSHELRDIQRLIEQHVDDLLKDWEAAHGDAG